MDGGGIKSFRGVQIILHFMGPNILLHEYICWDYEMNLHFQLAFTEIHALLSMQVLIFPIACWLLLLINLASELSILHQNNLFMVSC